LWEKVQRYIAKKLNVKTVTYESAGRPGKTVKEVLEKMLAEATFAVLVMTADDQTLAGSRRARQNVVHEAGYFQGVLGFDRAVMLLESGTEAFSNITGVQLIKFERNTISTAFPKLKRALDAAGLLAKESAAHAK
jgi:predicted nucleotide-binding protein